MIADTHIHTAEFSGDAKMRRCELIDFVSANPDTLFCTAEHYDYGYPVPENQLICDVEEYLRAYLIEKSEFENKYSKSYPVLFGIEYNYMGHLSEYYASLSARHPFDSVICSVHLLGDIDPFFNRDIFGLGRFRVYSDYLTCIIDSLKVSRYFDAVGHFDYLSRYSGYPDARILYKDFPDYFDEIFRLAIQHSKAIEFNTATSAVFQSMGIDDFLPDPDIFRRYRELGGELVTYGSDAHRSDQLLKLSKQACGLLKEAGFEYMTYFKERKPVFYRIED
ncbi:MAG: histidinol-phosphatase HisJ family protein [Saccharofermentanales bacterium]